MTWKKWKLCVALLFFACLPMAVVAQPGTTYTLDLSDGESATIRCDAGLIPVTQTDTEAVLFCGEQPVAGALCPAWVHDGYTTTGPDGRTYPTWHPIIDAQYGCGFDHEHGSDPSLVGDGSWEPPFGYVGNATHHSESAFGYKVVVFTDDFVTKAGEYAGTYDVGYVIHMGSTVQSRVCIASHEIQFHVANHNGYPEQFTNSQGQVIDVGPYQVVTQRFELGDFGEARENVTDKRIPLSSCIDPKTGMLYHEPRGYETLTIDGVEYVNDTSGVGERHISTFDPAINQSVGYEPWIVDHLTPYKTGLMIRGLSVNAHSSVTHCTDVTCAAMADAGDELQRHGAYRTVVFTNNSVSRFGFVDVIDSADGWFTTDGFGNLGGSIPQYTLPGLEIYAVKAGRKFPQAPENGAYDNTQQTWFGRPQMNPLRLLGAN